MNPTDENEQALMQRFEEAVRGLVFVGFNSRVCALSRDTGELVWKWKSPEGRSPYVALLLDGDRLMVSVQGYTYCLNPLNGEQVWKNPLSGFGVGVPSLASANGSSGAAAPAEVLAAQTRNAGAAAGVHGAGGFG